MAIIKDSIKAIILSFIVLLSFYFVLAQTDVWTLPGVAPPDGNPPAPLNTGPGSQTKLGSLSVESLSTGGLSAQTLNTGSLNVSNNGNFGGNLDVGGILTGTQIKGAELCIGSVCKSAWPSVSGGLSGSGSSGVIPVWTGATSLGNSVISQSGSAVTISGSLTVSGSLRATGGTIVRQCPYTVHLAVGGTKPCTTRCVGQLTTNRTTCYYETNYKYGGVTYPCASTKWLSCQVVGRLLVN